MTDETVSLLDVLLGDGAARRPSWLEPTLLPHLTALTPESSLSFLCDLAQHFAGPAQVFPSWPALGGAVFTAVASRLPRLEHPERLLAEHPMLVWFTPQAEGLDTTQLAAEVERGESWLPLAVDCRHPESMVRPVAEIGRRSGKALVERFFARWIGQPLGQSALLLHLLPTVPSEERYAVAHRAFEALAGSIPQPYWLASLAVSRLACADVPDLEQPLASLLARLAQEWSPHVSGLLSAPLADVPFPDVLRAHPGADRLARLDETARLALARDLEPRVPELLSAIIHHWGGAGPPPRKKRAKPAGAPARRRPSPDRSKRLILPGNGGGPPPSPPSTAPIAPVEAEPAESVRHIGIWMSEGERATTAPLTVGETYTLNVKVGDPVAATLVVGPQAEVPTSDIPTGGLQTEWTIVARGARLQPVSTGVEVKPLEGAAEQAWAASFGLRIPRSDDSETVRLLLTPLGPDAALSIRIFGRRELYRSLEVTLAVARPGVAAGGETSPVSVQHDTVQARGAELDARRPHEWTTPPYVLELTAFPNGMGFRGRPWAYLELPHIGPDFVIPWPPAAASMAGEVENVQKALDAFRQTFSDYLDAIDPDDLDRRLSSFPREGPGPPYDWTSLSLAADTAHLQRWQQVAASDELRSLADAGYRLYASLFPAGSSLRKLLDGLRPGSHLEIAWQPMVPGWISNVPWGLMHLQPPDPTKPIDPTLFFGLRFRIAYLKWKPAEATDALGDPGSSHVGHCLYWGRDGEDAEEAARQRRLLQRYPAQHFVPSDASAGSARKTEVKEFFGRPAPAPMTILHLFGHCDVGKGNEPVLRFGDTRQADDVLELRELGLQALNDRPLVFANACTTAAADPYISNQLERSFVELRGCRAYLGTEAKVPVHLASRFATTFFRFLFGDYGGGDTPLPAGECVTQARLFFWTRYCNIGGLFYTYVNRYELQLSSRRAIEASAAAAG